MDSAMLLAQGVGLLGMVAGIYGYAQKNDAKLKLSMTASGLLLTLHFFMLSAPAGALASLLNSARFFSSHYFKCAWVGLMFILLYACSSFVTYQALYDFLPAYAGITGTIAVFFFTHLKMRYLLLTTNIAWIIYSMMNGSVGSTLLSTFLMVTMLITIYRVKKETNHA